MIIHVITRAVFQTLKMSDIRQYFKPSLEARLPTTVSKTTIRAVEKELKVRNTEDTHRGPYIKVSEEERAKVGCYATKNGITAAIRYFKRNGKYSDLKGSSYSSWLEKCVATVKN